ncbi:hypothetical protein BH10ACT3_BH10ACT3_18220 [soil metagenome]
MSETRPLTALDWRGASLPGPGNLAICGARVVDPRSGIDGERDIVIRDGRIESIGEAGSLSADLDGDIEVIEAGGLAAFPGFFDPHVHLRTPGQEYKEDIETGTRSAAAGGYVGVVAMANTSPPVDEPSTISARRERAAT